MAFVTVEWWFAKEFFAPQRAQCGRVSRRSDRGCLRKNAEHQFVVGIEAKCRVSAVVEVARNSAVMTLIIGV